MEVIDRLEAEGHIADEVFPFVDTRHASKIQVQLNEEMHYGLRSIGFPELWGRLSPGEFITSPVMYTPLLDSRTGQWTYAHGQQVKQYVLVRTERSEWDFFMLEFDCSGGVDLVDVFTQNGYRCGYETVRMHD